MPTVTSRIAAPVCTGMHAPFWFWNGPLDPDTMREQIALMAEQGLTAAMPHPRFGMDRREYLEDPYWAAMDATVDEAAKRGMQVLLYDEYNWPSGAAGGRSTDGHPEYLPRALDYAVREIAGAGAVQLDGFCAGHPYSGMFEKIIAAFLVPNDCPWTSDGGAELLWPEGGTTVRWGVITPDGQSVSGNAPAEGGRVLVFFQTRCAFPSRLNVGSDAFLGYLQPGATERFIEVTHEAYAARYAQHFGKLISAIFTDEPSTISPGPFPWSDDFVDQFHERIGYDLLDMLPALCDDRVPGGWRGRADYWRFVAELFDERFFKPVADWCRSHSIAFTGHCFDENIAAWPCAPDLMRFLRRMDWPGIDALGTHAHAAGCKIAASVAHLEDKPHFLCEALGLADGWNATLAMLKRGYQYLGVMGVDMFVPHGFHQTVETPRMECPPSFFFQNPYWPYYHRLRELTDRLSAFNQSGTHLAPVAVYYPIESLHADGTGGRGQGGFPWQQLRRGNRHAVQTIETFNAVITHLSAGPYDCDVVDAVLLRQAQVDAATGELRIGPESFSCFVLPAVRTIPADVAEILAAFVHAGGILVIVGATPERAYPQADADVAARFAQLLKYPGKGKAVVVDGIRSAGEAGAALDGVFAEHVLPTIRFPQGCPAGLLTMARRSDTSTQWLLVNDGKEPVACEVVLPRERLPRREDGRRLGVQRIDVATGRVERLPLRAHPDGWSVMLHLGDTEAAVLVAEHTETATMPEAAAAEPPAPASSVTLEGWTLQLLPAESRDVFAESAVIQLPVFRWSPRTADTGRDWMRPGYDDAKWTPVAAVREEALQSAAVALFRGMLPPGARALQLPLPASGEYAVYVNGTCLEERIGLPAALGVLDFNKITQGLGDVVAMEVCSESVFSGLTAPLEVECDGVALPCLKPWSELGLDWYVGRACYRTELVLEKVPPVAWLDLGEVQHYAEVWVNGVCAGLSLWPPYRLEVGAFLKSGVNDIRILVSNSVANRFVWDRWTDSRTGASWKVPPKAEPSGLIGPVCLLA